MRTHIASIAGATIRMVVGGQERLVDVAHYIPVTLRSPHDELLRSRLERECEWRGAGVQTLQPAGDVIAPGTVAAAVYAGAQLSRELGVQSRAFLRKRIVLDATLAPL